MRFFQSSRGQLYMYMSQMLRACPDLDQIWRQQFTVAPSWQKQCILYLNFMKKYGLTHENGFYWIKIFKFMYFIYKWIWNKDITCWQSGIRDNKPYEFVLPSYGINREFHKIWEYVVIPFHRIWENVIEIKRPSCKYLNNSMKFRSRIASRDYNKQYCAITSM